MAYGTVKVDTIIFDQGGADQNVTVSGIYRAITSGVTVSGTISGAVLVGTTTVSGTTVTGTTANFVSGVFTTVVSGATVTGTQSSFTSGNFVTLSGTTATFTSGVIASGTAAAPSLSIISDPNTGIYSPGVDQVAVATNGTGRLFIDANGNIGVGVTPVDVAGFNSIQIGDTNGVFFDCFTGATHEARILSLPGDLRINQITSGSLGLYTNNTERLRITSAGLVGIGTSSPQAQLQVLDRIKISDSTQAQGSLQLGDGASTTFNVGLARWNGSANAPGAAGLGYFSQGTGNSGGHYFYTGDVAAGSQTARMIIAPGGNVGIGTTSPGDKLDVLGIVRATNTTDSNFYSTFSNPDGLTRIRAYGGGSSICFDLGTSEKARIDSSGRLLVGTSTARSIATQSLAIQNEGTSFGTTGFSTCRNSNDIYGPYIHFGKTRGASVGSNTIVASGDDLGGLIFGGADGTDVDSQAAYIICKVDGTPGANDMPGRLEFWTTPDGASSPTERMRINQAGVAEFNKTGVLNTWLQVYNGNSSQDLAFVSSDSAGNEWHFGRQRADGYFYVVRQTGTGMYMDTNSWVATSDQRAKQNIADIESTIDAVKALKPSRFNWKTDGTADVGFIAQQVQTLIPEAVVDSGKPEAMLGITQDKLLPFVVKALQEAIAKIETLEARLAAAGIE